MAQTVGLEPGTLIFQLGDTHVYSQHVPAAKEYINRLRNKEYSLLEKPGK